MCDPPHIPSDVNPRPEPHGGPMMNPPKPPLDNVEDAKWLDEDDPRRKEIEAYENIQDQT